MQNNIIEILVSLVYCLDKVPTFCLPPYYIKYAQSNLSNNVTGGTEQKWSEWAGKNECNFVKRGMTLYEWS